MISKPRVSQVVWSLERAGAERVVFDLIACLRDRYEMRLIAAGGGGAMEKEFRSLGVDVVLAPKKIQKLSLLAFMAKELKQHPPDLLHTHVGGDVWAGAIAYWEGLHPWISTAHNEDMDDPFIRHLLRRCLAKKPDHTVCVSHVVKAYTHEEFGVPLQQLSVIPNGIDMTHLFLRPSRPYHDVPKLISVGRLAPQKGQDVLLRALARVKRPWHLDICGEGPDRLKLEWLTASLGLLPRVTFLGNVSDVRERLAEADLFCFPSRHEGQSVAMLEAAASGVPIIASDIPVFHEWFDRSSILFVPPNDPEQWAKAIEQAWQTPTETFARAHRAQNIVSERGRRERMAEQYHHLYQRWLQTYAHSSRQ